MEKSLFTRLKVEHQTTLKNESKKYPAMIEGLTKTLQETQFVIELPFGSVMDLHNALSYKPGDRGFVMGTYDLFKDE